MPWQCTRQHQIASLPVVLMCKFPEMMSSCACSHISDLWLLCAMLLKEVNKWKSSWRLENIEWMLASTLPGHLMHLVWLKQNVLFESTENLDTGKVLKSCFPLLIILFVPHHPMPRYRQTVDHQLLINFALESIKSNALKRVKQQPSSN
jgi:hypothetical protein